MFTLPPKVTAFWAAHAFKIAGGMVVILSLFIALWWFGNVKYRDGLAKGRADCLEQKLVDIDTSEMWRRMHEDLVQANERLAIENQKMRDQTLERIIREHVAMPTDSRICLAADRVRRLQGDLDTVMSAGPTAGAVAGRD